APVAPAAELLEAQLAQCVDLIHQLGFIAGHPKCPDDERYHLLGNITSLLESSATVGKVIGRLRNGPEETRHRVIVEKGKKRGKGVRKSGKLLARNSAKNPGGGAVRPTGTPTR